MALLQYRQAEPPGCTAGLYRPLTLRDPSATRDISSAKGVRCSSPTNWLSWEWVRLAKMICGQGSAGRQCGHSRQGRQERRWAGRPDGGVCVRLQAGGVVRVTNGRPPAQRLQPLSPCRVSSWGPVCLHVHAYLALARHLKILVLPQPPAMPIRAAVALAAAAAAPAAAVQAQSRSPGAALPGTAASAPSCR